MTSYHCTQCENCFANEGAAMRCPKCGSFLVEAASNGSPKSVEHLQNDHLGIESLGPANPSYSNDELALVESYASDRLRIPAIGLLIGAVLTILLSTYKVTTVFTTDPMDWPEVAARPELMEPGAEKFVAMAARVGKVFALISFTLGLIILAGAVLMLQRRFLPLAVMGAIMGVVPCLSSCWFLTLPFGIWSLVILSDRPVRLSFQHAH